MKARAGLVCPGLIVVVGCIHRATFLAIHFQDLRDLISHNPDWLTWQYLSVPAVTLHLVNSMIYLQQTPPIPNLLLGLAAKVFGWPYGTAYALIGFQAGISVGSSVLLFSLLNSFIRRPVVSCAVAIVFLLSPDLLVMEYNALGQLFYENLAMFLLLVSVWFYYRVERTQEPVYAVGLGLTAAALALTRASFSYYFIVPGGLLAFATLRAGLRSRQAMLLVCFICGLTPHAAWVAKQCIVYGTCSVTTSSWRGVNFASGLAQAGRSQDFVQSILDQGGDYPAWFVTMIRSHGLVAWHPPTFIPYLPPSVRREEESIQAKLGHHNRSENTIGQRLVADLYLKAYVRFAVKHPGVIARKFLRSYETFWRPIRYGALFLAPLNVVPEIDRGHAVIRSVRVALREMLGGNQYLMRGPWLNRTSTPTSFLTLPTLPSLATVVNLLVLHTVVPVLVLSALLTLVKSGRVVLPREYLFLLTSYVYVAVLTNLPEQFENMRFRLSVEPVIWLTSAYSLEILTTLVRELQTARRRSAGGWSADGIACGPRPGNRGERATPGSS